MKCKQLRFLVFSAGVLCVIAGVMCAGKQCKTKTYNRLCESCSAPYEADAKFCGSCGEELSNS